MLRYMLRQTFFALSTMFFAILLIFVLYDLNTDMFLVSRYGSIFQESLVLVGKTEYNLNLPFFMRLLNWFSKVARGELFTNNVASISILPGLIISMAASLKIIFIAVLLSTLATIGMVIASLHFNHRGLESGIRFMGIVGISIPETLFCFTVFMLLRTNNLGLSLLGQGYPLFESPMLNYLAICLIPTSFLTFKLCGLSFRYLRSEMLAIKESEFIVAEKSRGLSNMRVYIGGILKNAYNAIIPNLATLVVEAMATMIVIESFFPVSRFFANFTMAAVNQDSHLVIANFVLVLTFLLLFNLLLDFLIGLIDPRVSYQ